MDFTEIVEAYGYPILIIAAAVMVVIGIIKIFTKMIPEKNSKLRTVFSYLYTIFAVVLSYGFICLYMTKVGPALGIDVSFDLEESIKMAISVFTITQVIYPIYRDYGGRFLFVKFLSIFTKKTSKSDKIIELVEKVVSLSDSQKENMKAELKKGL